MQYFADIARLFGLLVLFAAMGGVGFSTALELPAWKAALWPVQAAAPAQLKLATVHAPATSAPSPRAEPSAEDLRALAGRKLLMPVQGLDPRGLRDNYDEGRGKRKHEALDIMAPRGTPVVAVDDGRVGKLFRSVAGGITLYQIDRDEKFVYYYAHLENYAEGVKEGMALRRGDVIGYVGTTGNAPANAPHLHFAIFRMGPEKRWWKGTPVNPYPYLTGTA